MTVLVPPLKITHMCSVNFLHTWAKSYMESHFSIYKIKKYVYYQCCPILLKLCTEIRNLKIRKLPKFEVSNLKKMIQVNLSQKLFFLQNVGRTCCVQKLFWMSETIYVHNMFSPGLSLEFSRFELVIQWTICHRIVG